VDNAPPRRGETSIKGCPVALISMASLSFGLNILFFNSYLIPYHRDLRKSLDAIRTETDLQASYHLNLAQQFRTEFEVPTTAFHARQLHHKKTYQAGIEKEFKTKQTQESYVNKAREKYEQDCVRINSFTAQASLVQGKDLEKINLKLERTQQTVQTNEREFSNFSKALQETVMKWEQDWKSFCDSCQDLEEERMDFMKDNLWNYANAVSTVCVADDAVRFLMLSIRRCSHRHRDSPAKRSEFLLNKWRLKRIWKTLFGIMAQEIKFRTLLHSSIIKHQMPSHHHRLGLLAASLSLIVLHPGRFPYDNIRCHQRRNPPWSTPRVLAQGEEGQHLPGETIHTQAKVLQIFLVNQRAILLRQVNPKQLLISMVPPTITITPGQALQQILLHRPSKRFKGNQRSHHLLRRRNNSNSRGCCKIHMQSL